MWTGQRCIVLIKYTVDLRAGSGRSQTRSKMQDSLGPAPGPPQTASDLNQVQPRKRKLESRAAASITHAHRGMRPYPAQTRVMRQCSADKQQTARALLARERRTAERADDMADDRGARCGSGGVRAGANRAAVRVRSQPPHCGSPVPPFRCALRGVQQMMHMHMYAAPAHSQLRLNLT